MEKRHPVKNKRGNKAVTEVIGTMLLLGIAVSLFSIIYISVLSVPSTPPTPSANIACKVDGNRIILEHYGGDTLDLDTKLIITIGGMPIETTVGDVNSSLSWDSNNDEKWGMGERLVYSEDGLYLGGKQVEIGVVDVGSNSLVMVGTIQGGISSAPSLVTHVNTISPYNQTSSPLTITATGDSGLDNVTLWYRYSTDNMSWSGYSSFGTDTLPSWQWSFNFPDGKGFYEFYSIGMYSGAEESEPASADAMCFYNQAPEISDPYPANEAIDIPANPTLNITVSDFDGNHMDITWYSNSSGSWQIFGTNTSVSNGTYHQTNNNFSNYGEIYYWYVSVSDGSSAGNSPIYHFTTEPIDTWVDSVSTSPPYEITASGPSDLNNVTLWYRYSSNNWSYYRTITIDHTNVDENLVNFPVLVEISSAIGSKCDDGDSIRFFDVDNSTEYYYEIEHWDGSGNSYVWVKIPSISATEDTVFLMHYNNSEASDNQHPEDVWDSNYAGVWHFAEASGNYFDSTNNGNDGTTVSVASRTVSGKMGFAPEFDGYNDYITVPDDNSLDLGSYTIEAWIYPHDTDNWRTISAKGYSGTFNWYAVLYSDDLINRNGHGGNEVQSFGGYSEYVWQHVTVITDEGNSEMRLYRNAVENSYTQQDWGGNSDNNNDDMQIGMNDDWGEYFDGIIDELRISKIIRSDSWIKAGYSNQNNPSSFLTIGSEQSITGATSWTEFETDTTSGDGWSWNFDFPNGTGYYEFYSIGKKTGSPDEIAPGIADASCNFIINNAPNTPSNPVPSDGASEIGLNPTLSVDVSDPDGDSMDVTFYDASDDSVIDTDTGVSSGGTASVTWSGLVSETSYSWYAVADDSIAGSTQSDTWSFTTGNLCPVQTTYDFTRVSTAEDGEIDVSDSMISGGTFPARRDSINGWTNWGGASNAEYANLVGSDNNRYRGADPGSGDNAAMIFEFIIEEDHATITQIDVAVELGRASSTDAGFVYLWNYNTNSYLVLGSNGGSSDQVISSSITTNPGDYVDAGTGQLTVFVVNQDTSDWIQVDNISIQITDTTPEFHVHDFSRVSTAEDGEIDVSDSMISGGTFPARRDSINGWTNWGGASNAEYANLVGSDNNRYRGADPGSGDNAAMIFEFIIEEDHATITQIDVAVELGRASSTDAGFVYLWNYNTNSYLVLGSNGGSSDQVISSSITTNPGDYVDAGTGQLTVFVVNQDTSDWIQVDDINIEVIALVPC